MNADDKAPPKGALEEAVSLCDELITFATDATDPERQMKEGEYEADAEWLEQIRRRRAALEPRLAKRRENQAKGRGGKP